MNGIFKIAAVVMILSFSVCLAASTEEDWQRLTDEALDLYYYGNYKEAVGVAREALKTGEELFGPDDLKVAGSVDNLATYMAAAGNTKEADRLYQRALSILREKLPPNDQYLAIFMDYLAIFYDKIGKNGYAKELRERAKAIRLKKSAG
ncbi:MAG: tetratricopeptide repeat protein [Candidatus Omnitrophica bacterium]|nr:tetratricopeptide repeat protein [Candidatus Omnitrophota bacterium]